MMVLSTLLGPGSSHRGGGGGRPAPAARPPKASPRMSDSFTAASTSALGTALPGYIYDESQLAPPPPLSPDLRLLNHSVEALAAVFPDVQIEVFREMLSSFEGESRLALVANALLQNRASWVKGRWKVAAKGKTEASADDTAAGAVRRGLGVGVGGPVPNTEAFRSDEYKDAVKSLAWQEFRGLTRSTINALLAEHNYSYLDARPILTTMSAKSWRFAISSLFIRRKAAAKCEAENHPLVIWKSTGQGSIIPTFKATGDAELDRELFGALIAPLIAQQKTKQEAEDRLLAIKLNVQEAEELETTYECTCCFSTVVFEEVTICGARGHIVCFRCVRHSISEAVFGQGWHRSISAEMGTLRCLAVDREECEGCIPRDHISRAMLDRENGASILRSLEQRLAKHSLLSADLPLVRCPFCEYAEVDEVYLLPTESRLRIKTGNVLLVVLAAAMLGVLPVLISAIPALLVICFAAAVSGYPNPARYLLTHYSASLTRLRRRRRGPKFACQSPACGRVSCLACAKEWVDVHVCHESALVALRTRVEQAMSLAIKRVCPRCHTSFVKDRGCNKLTCPCGYKMCYVCRRDIGGPDGPDAGYRHFCEHFRPEGDGRPCDQCGKCNLWEREDTEAVLRAAREEAERKWRETENRDLSGAERAYLETGVAVKQRSQEVWQRRRWPSVEEVFDFLVEAVIA